MKRKKTPSVLPLAIIAGGAALSAIVLAQNGKPAVKPGGKTVSEKTSSEPAVQISRARRQPLEYYTGGVRADLFGQTPPPPTRVEPVKVVLPDPPKIEPVKIDPFAGLADYAYSGTVTIGSEPMALIENTKTREGHYLKVGDMFAPVPNVKITAIDDRSVTLDLAGTPRTVTKSDDFKLTPLNASAGFLQPNANQPQPGATPQPSATANPMGGAGGMRGPGGMDWSNFRNMTPEQRRAQFEQMRANMTPEQRERMQQRFNNRAFEGRRGGRGGFGGDGDGGGRRNRD